MKFNFIVKLIKLLILVFSVSATCSELTPVSHDEQAENMTCLIKYIYSYFKHVNLKIYISENYTGEIKDEVISRVAQNDLQTYTVEIFSCYLHRQTCKKGGQQMHSQVIIFVDSASQLNNIFQNCLCTTTADSLILVLSGSRDTTDLLRVMKDHNFFLKPVVSEFNKTLVVLHSVNTICKKLNEISDIFFYVCANKGKNKSNSYIKLKDKQPCVLKIGVRLAPPFTYINPEEVLKDTKLIKHPYRGKELLHMEMLIKSHNVIMEYIPFNTNELGKYDHKNRVGNGLIKELIDGKIDIIFGALIQPYPSKYVQSIMSMAQDTIVAIARKQKLSIAYSVFAIYTWPIWWCILLVYSCYIVLLYVIKYIQKNVPIDSVIFKLISIFLGQSIKISRRFPRLLFLSWIWFAFMMRAYYEAYTKKLFLEKDSPRQIDTLEELCFNGYTIFVSNYIYDYFEDGMRLPNCNITSDKMFVVDDPLRELRDSQITTTAVFMFRETYENFFKNYIVHGENKFHVVKESIGLVMFYIYSRYGELATNIIGIKARRIIESGILNHGIREMEIRSRQDHDGNTDCVEATALSMKNVEAAFLVYLCGVIICIVCFIIEILVGKCKLMFKKKD